MSELHELAGVVRAWIEKAEHDLKTAEHTLRLSDDCPFDTICFHAQQCAEKYLKALLVYSRREFPKTHDLAALLRLLSSEPTLQTDVDALLALNRYTVEARYPGDWEPMDRPEAERAVELARKLRTAVRALLPKDILGS